jgi:hemerythrin superfamily protein
MALMDNSEGLPAAQPDVVDVLLAQHERVRELVAEVSTAQGEARLRAFNELRTLLALHEAAEEAIVHPTTHDALAEARVEEEQHAARAIAQLETFDLADPAFDRAFAAFAQAVFAHAEKEEREEFPALRQNIPAPTLQAMADRVVSGQQDAYAHLAGGMPDAVGVETEPFAALLDEAGAAMSRH